MNLYKKKIYAYIMINLKNIFYKKFIIFILNINNFIIFYFFNM